jgi:hypothetical protein
MKAFTGQQCAGCGIYAEKHPMVAVMATGDASVLPLASSKDGKFVVVGVCNDCHQDPAHRHVPIKGAFFTPEQATDAVALAGERDAKGNPVRS